MDKQEMIVLCQIMVRGLARATKESLSVEDFDNAWKNTNQAFGELEDEHGVVMDYGCNIL